MLRGAPYASAGTRPRRAQVLNTLRLQRGRCSDSLAEQVVCGVPRAGIVIGLRRKQARNDANALAAGRRRAVRAWRPAHGEPSVSGDRELTVRGVVDHFNGVETQVDALRWLVGVSRGITV